MKNYTKTNIGNEGRTELHEALGLTGAEISVNRGLGLPHFFCGSPEFILYLLKLSEHIVY